MCNKSNYMEMMKIYIEYDRIEKAAKAEKEKAKKELIAYMQEIEEFTLEHDGMKAKYTVYEEHRFDSKVFQADNPEIYEKYRLPKTAKRFTCN